MASPSKSVAKHMIIIPTTILSIFMNSYFARDFLIILCVDYIQQKGSQVSEGLFVGLNFNPPPLLTATGLELKFNPTHTITRIEM